MITAFLLPVLYAIVGTSLETSTVRPNDPRVRYIGRFDFQDPAGPRCAWPASTVEFCFRGVGLKAKIRDEGSDRFQIVVDGTPTQVIKLRKGDLDYDLATGLSNDKHTVELVKRTEAFAGTTQFLDFEVDGTLERPQKPKHILEVIGDSISCGFGNEGKTKAEPFSIETENAYLTYGAITARAFNADFIDIAWSGRTMWPTNSIPEIYDLALPADKSTKWNLKQEIPSAIVINLATNDFGKANPDEKGWTEAYAAFIGRLRQRAPRAMVYCAIGPMMTDNWPPTTKALTTLRTYLTDVLNLRTAVGDTKIKVIEFETQNEERDGIGSSWHPNTTTHRNMANKLIETIHKDLGW